MILIFTTGVKVGNGGWQKWDQQSSSRAHPNVSGCWWDFDLKTGEAHWCDCMFDIGTSQCLRMLVRFRFKDRRSMLFVDVIDIFIFSCLIWKHTNVSGCWWDLDFVIWYLSHRGLPFLCRSQNRGCRWSGTWSSFYLIIFNFILVFLPDHCIKRNLFWFCHIILIGYFLGQQIP